jgi:hypothetical protein
MTAEPLSTDHLLAPTPTTVKQLSLEPFQALQKPSFDSFQVPSPLLPVPIGTRFILPSAVNVILNLTFDGVEAVNGSPLKKVDWISAGVSLDGGAAVAAVAKKIAPTITALATLPRIVGLRPRKHCG